MSKNILVGMSGGVDSSVCALLLKEKGYNVIGAIMALWGKRDVSRLNLKKTNRDSCFKPNEKENIEAAKKIAQEIGIDFYEIDCTQKYNEIVLEYFRNEYLKGRTPNPCIRCNPLVKFGAFPELAKEKGINFDYFATGHYARIEKENGRFLLKRGVNHKKDQSYFLYKLTQEQLSKIILPLGGFSKEEIRLIAQKYGLGVANKPDSQDFYNGDYNELLDVQEKEGNIVDTEGKILGKHKGIWNYTVGQRKGIGLAASEALYVLALDKDKNEVIVGFKDKTFNKILYANDINIIDVDKFKSSFRARAKFRSVQELQDVTVEKIDEKNFKVIFDEYQKSIAIGQAVVLYDEDIVIGGGTIDKVE